MILVNFLLLFVVSFSSLFASQEKVEKAFVRAAKDQIGKTTSYNPAYQKLPYTNGDVNIQEGVCKDVIIRAFRKAFGVDLQKLVYVDKKRNWTLYPNPWNSSKVDTNIDHRRVPNLMHFFKTHGMQVHDKAYVPGDIVVWNLGEGILHIGILSNSKTSLFQTLLNSGSGTPLVVHNISCGVQEEDILDHYKIIAHYRINEQIIKELKKLEK
jgi:uncharacterized protein YijF (DUF1287 family)